MLTICLTADAFSIPYSPDAGQTDFPAIGQVLSISGRFELAGENIFSSSVAADAVFRIFDRLLTRAAGFGFRNWFGVSAFGFRVLALVLFLSFEL